MAKTRTQALQGQTVLRPVLTLLNGDNSWLISLPRPSSERATGSKTYFHAVLDPWLVGDAVLFFSRFVHIHRPFTPSVPSGTAVESLVAEIEAVANPGTTREDGPLVDAIFISHDLADHTHKPTLDTFDPRIPVFAVPESAAAVRSWKRFVSITEIRDIDPSSPKFSPVDPLPSWISLLRIPGHSSLNFALAIVYSLDPQATREAIFYAPHGMKADGPAVKAFARELGNGIEVAALLTSLKQNYALGFSTTLGPAGGLAVERLLRPRCWVITHNRVLKYGGIVSWLLGTRDVEGRLEDALQKERAENGGEELGKPKMVQPEDGVSFVLE
ncbi:hypothetical protein QBC47DRAFT_435537 [Echria macrotheca]|uniref:Uncharacterized protein n=1 Tax=Echria macrotheca TaxID=438768 RepID=A0AAJ0B5T0_9PEZI|nr:hypothetical protein QBC47DRAFT_435537 [Echria macrotheca]